jgi:hypothetical protein
MLQVLLEKMRVKLRSLWLKSILYTPNGCYSVVLFVACETLKMNEICVNGKHLMISPGLHQSRVYLGSIMMKPWVDKQDAAKNMYALRNTMNRYKLLHKFVSEIVVQASPTHYVIEVRKV